jgi:hypothetical protein
MAALFLLMILPTGGWYFIAEFTSGDRWEALPASGQATRLEAQREVRFKLALTLVASILVLAATVVYLRRTVLDPLDNLARRARTVGQTPESPRTSAIARTRSATWRGRSTKASGRWSSERKIRRASRPT